MRLQWMRNEKSCSSPKRLGRSRWAIVLIVCMGTLAITPGLAGQAANAPAVLDAIEEGSAFDFAAAKLRDGQIPDPLGQENFSATMKIMALLTILSLAPAILVMMTCFTRIVVVLALLRQALSTQQLPPNQVIVGLALFMTFMVMGETWKGVNEDAISPYNANEINAEQAISNGAAHLRAFMINQIKATGNQDDVQMFLDYKGQTDAIDWKDVPTGVLVPAFITSELKTAFILGFRIFLPFVIIDMVVASILISMGMLMLPPVLISLPFKLLLFVLVNGWHLVIGTLLGSFVM